MRLTQLNKLWNWHFHYISFPPKRESSANARRPPLGPRCHAVAWLGDDMEEERNDVPRLSLLHGVELFPSTLLQLRAQLRERACL